MRRKATSRKAASFNHTPGPWVAEQGARDRWGIVSIAFEDERPGICGDHSRHWRLTGDDAFLIAQSPALLAGLIHVGGTGHRFGSVESLACRDCVAAAKAIEKARG